MDNFLVIGKSVNRKDSKDKAAGTATYANDYEASGIFHARLVISPYAHAKIISINTDAAWKVPGVRALLTGKDHPILTGSTIMDKPPIAIDRARYHGEPVAVVVADSEVQADRAADLIKIEYEPLAVVNSPTEAVRANAPLVHENLEKYSLVDDVYPEPGTNIANRTKIRKGDIKKGWMESEVVVEADFSFPQSDHAAMETRCCTVKILPDERVVIYSSSQSPFHIKELMSTYFNIEPGKVIVNVPFVGGAYGGKTPVHLEVLAFLASKAVGGRPVKLVNTREEDMISSPVHIGMNAKIKLGCTKKGKLRAVEITYLFDGGAYADRAVLISRAAAVDCTGPYNIANVYCDSLCMYTNHPFATAFRGFGHSELAFAMERTMDILAKQLNMDALELRLKNAIMPGDTTPTQAPLNYSNLGNLPKCVLRLAELIGWHGGARVEVNDHKVRSWGISCFWKTSTIPTSAGAGAVLTFNPDGSLNLNCAAVEIGQGTKTALAQIVSEKMKMDVSKVHVIMEVNTQTDPDHWKTAASRTTLLVGRAALNVAEDAICQLKKIASCVLGSPEGDLEVGYGRVFFRDNPAIGIDIKDIALGYTYPNGYSIGGQVIGRGSYILRHMTHIDRETGRGTPGPEWTLGAAAVEVELNTKDYTYEITNAVCVIDAGKVINFKAAEGQIMGGMCMGLSFASKESFLFTDKGIIQNPVLRTYRTMRFGENPKYLVDFVETPHLEAPYGARGIGEHGVIGMPGALANSLSNAAAVPLNELPLTPESIWMAVKRRSKSDII